MTKYKHKERPKMGEYNEKRWSQVEARRAFGARSIKFKEIAQAYRKHLLAEGRLRRDTELRISVLVRDIGEEPIQNITAAFWRDYVHRKWVARPKPCSPGTIDRNTKVLRAIYNHAQDMGWVDDRPPFKSPSYRDARTFYLEPEEVMPVVNYLTRNYGAMYGFVTLLLCDTGMRMGEAFEMRWKDFGKHWMTVRPPSSRTSKTLARRIPTSPRLLRFMALNKIGPDGSINELVIETRWTDNRGTISRRLNEALREAAVAIGVSHGAELRVHDLRHTFAYICADAGADLADLQTLLGHQNINMTMRYRGFVKGRAKAIVDKMGSVST